MVPLNFEEPDLRAWLRRRLHVDDPNLLPFKVRMFMVAHWAVASLGIGLVQPGWLHGFAHVGLVFAALAASILFWESRLQPNDIHRVTWLIKEAGQTRTLTKSDRRGVYMMAAFFGVIAAISVLALWGLYEASGNGWRFFGQTVIILSFIAGMIGLLYAITKSTRVYFYKRATILKDVDANPDEQALFVKRYLQTLAFFFLLAASVLQIPVNLWWKDVARAATGTLEMRF